MRYLISIGPGIGDFVQYISLAKVIHNEGHSVDFISSSSKERFRIQAELLKYQDSVDNLYYYSKSELFHTIVMMLKMINRYDYGIIRVDNFNGRNQLWIEKIMRFIRCKTIVVNRHSNIERIHYHKKNEQLAETIGIKYKIEKINFDLSKLPRIIDKTEKIRIGFSIGTNQMIWNLNGENVAYDVKSWAYDKWAELINRVSSCGCECVILGGSKELKELEALGIQFNNNSKGKVINVVGKTSIGESLSWLYSCDLVLGAEGGMLHCANALGKKCMTIFGGSDYVQWNPGDNSKIIVVEQDCYPCFGTEKAVLCKNHKCLHNITVEMVLSKILDYINTKNDEMNNI